MGWQERWGVYVWAAISFVALIYWGRKIYLADKEYKEERDKKFGSSDFS